MGSETETSSNDANEQISELFDKLDLSKASVHFGQERNESNSKVYYDTYRIDVLTVDTDAGRISLHIKVCGLHFGNTWRGWPKAYIVQVGKSKCDARIEWLKYNSILAAITAKEAQNALETMQKITKTS